MTRSRIRFADPRSLVLTTIATMMTLALLCSQSIRYGHADAPIADTPEGVQPVAVGETAPRFVVQTVDGDNVDFDPRKLERPTILITFRGGWCPYCNVHLSELRHVLPEIGDMDIDVLFLSGDRPDQLYSSLRMDTKEDIEGLDYTILSDANANAAIALGIAFNSDATLKRRKERGHDVEGSSMAKRGVLPVPAVFAIDANGIVTYAHVVPDYKVRLPADELLDVAKSLAGS